MLSIGFFLHFQLSLKGFCNRISPGISQCHEFRSMHVYSSYSFSVQINHYSRKHYISSNRCPEFRVMSSIQKHCSATTDASYVIFLAKFKLKCRYTGRDMFHGVRFGGSR